MISAPSALFRTFPHLAPQPPKSTTFHRRTFMAPKGAKKVRKCGAR